MTADTIAKLILGLERRIEQLDRRLNNTLREARVVEIDADKHLLKVEAHGLKSGWSPWAERAGTITTWTPPAVGERVLFVSPTGEPGQGIVLAGGYSDDFEAPSKSKDESVLTVGDLTVTYNKEKAVISLKGGGRCVLTKRVAKLKVGDDVWFVLDGEDKKIVTSHMPVIGPDPDQN